MSRSRKVLCTVDPPQLEGAAGAWVELVRRAKTFVDIFPPLGLGLGAGVGLGCGLGWNFRAMYGPPRAFCGAGIGVGFAVGYGHGPLGRRFGKDTRSDEAVQRIKNVEAAIDGATKALVERLKALLPGGREASPTALQLPAAPAGAGGRVVGFVHPPPAARSAAAFSLPTRRGRRAVCGRSRRH